MKANQELRCEIESNRLKYWEVAEKIGITASNMTVWFRTEMNAERKSRVEKAIEELIKR